MAGNYRLLKCTIIAANLLLLLLVLLINTYTCTAGAAQSFLPVTSSVSSCGSGPECATAGGGVVIGEEFVMMDSETSKKLLESAPGSGDHLSYSTLDSAPVCNAAVQNSCFTDQKYGKMNCGTYHRTCGGGGP
nr:uncharacterized protein LOC109153653 isoform X1 [Ipomoea batatas]